MPACVHCGNHAPGPFCQHCGTAVAERSARAVALSDDGRTAVQFTPEVPGPLRLRGTFDPEQTVPAGPFESRLRDVAAGHVGAGAAVRLALSDEEVHWSGAPSPYLIVGPALQVVGAVVLSAALAGVLRAPYLLGATLAAGCVRLVVKHFELASIRYRVSSQRLEVTEGLWHQSTRAAELHQLAPGTISSPLLLRLFGLANLHVAGAPGAQALLGLPEATARFVRDVLRENSQLEGTRLDKVRFR